MTSWKLSMLNLDLSEMFKPKETSSRLEKNTWSSSKWFARIPLFFSPTHWWESMCSKIQRMDFSKIWPLKTWSTGPHPRRWLIQLSRHSWLLLRPCWDLTFIWRQASRSRRQAQERYFKLPQTPTSKIILNTDCHNKCLTKLYSK